MRAKKLFSYVICVLLAILLACAVCFGLTACGDGEEETKPPVENGKPHLPKDEYEDEGTGYVDNTPDDPGVPVSHVFEAEDCNTGSSYCMAGSGFFDLSFGGNLLSRNNESGYRFEFESDSAYKVDMKMGITSAFGANDWTESSLSDMFDIVVNGREPAALSETNVPAGDETQVRGGNIYTCVQDVSMRISLVKGENTITFYPVSELAGLDYIDIATSAEITYAAEVTEPADATKTTITKLPTATEEGKIVFSCDTHNKNNSFDLPALTENAGYTVTEKEGITTYSFDLCGGTYAFTENGGYELPDGAVYEEEPAAYEAVITGKAGANNNFFLPDNWQTFESGDSGEKPAKTPDGALEFTDGKGARFDLFYIAADKHIADKASNLSGKKDFYGQDYTYRLKMSATDEFDVLLFATWAATMRFEDNDGNKGNGGGIYLNISKDKISVRNYNYKYETVKDVVAEADISVPLDGSEFELAVTANRLSDNWLRFGIEVNGEKAVFVTKNNPVTTETDSLGNVLVTSSDMYGQRLCVVPGSGAKTDIYNIALPGKDYLDFSAAPEPPDPGDLPSVTVNGKEFFSSDNWTTFVKGSESGAKPTVENGKLVFAKPARFEFFYVKDGVHIGDAAENISDKSFFGSEYTWTLEMAADGEFSVLLFANNNFPALFEDAMASSGVSGAYLTFGNGTLTVSHMQHVYNETAATAVTENVTDGEEFTLGITAVRENDSSVSFSLTINGVPVTFTQSGDPTVTTVETDKITLNSEADMMFGQRLCIVPDPDSTVSVSGLTLPGEQTA